MIGTIYALSEPNSGNLRYCGKTVRAPEARRRAHERDAYRYKRRHLCTWVRSVLERGERPTIVVCEQLDLSNLERAEQVRRLNEAERRWIAQLRALGFDLTNATNGGDGAHGRKVSEESRLKARLSNSGKKRTAQTVENIKRAALARSANCYLRGSDHQHHGKLQTWRDPEARARRIRETWKSPEVLARPRKTVGENNGKARITSEIARQLFVATGTLDEIAERFGVHRQTIWQVKNRKTWRHATNLLLKG